MEDIMVKKETKKTVRLSGEERFENSWEQIVEDVSAAFRMDLEEKEWLRTKNIARLIAAIPFLAHCEDAERTAVSHLGTYLLSLKETKHYYNASVVDNGKVFDRLRLIGSFKGGDEAVIKKGMSLLALNMLHDYKRDIHVDEAVGKYNPIGDNAMSYEKQCEELEYNVETADCPAMEAILGEAGTFGWWGF
jgi:hypothetical protein